MNEKISGNLGKYGIVLIFIGICILLSIAAPNSFPTVRNWLNIIRQVSIIGVIAIGVTFAIITTGIDLSSGSVIALTSVMVASLVQNKINPNQFVSASMFVPLAIIAVLLVGAFLGAISGTLHAYMKIPAFIATLGMMTIARGGALLYANGRPIGDLKSSFTSIGRGSFLFVPNPIWIYAAVAIFSFILLNKTQFGRHVFAIGGNMQAARICGIKVERTLVFVYAYAGLLSAVSGILLTSRTVAGNPTYGLSYELDAIASTVIGGTSLSGGSGSIFFCVIGAMIIGVLNNGMDLLGINAYWQQIAKGLIIVIAVVIDAAKRSKSAH